MPDSPDYQKSPKYQLFTRLGVNDLGISSTYDGKNPLTINTASTHYRIYTLAFGSISLSSSLI